MGTNIHNLKQYSFLLLIGLAFFAGLPIAEAYDGDVGVTILGEVFILVSVAACYIKDFKNHIGGMSKIYVMFQYLQAYYFLVLFLSNMSGAVLSNYAEKIGVKASLGVLVFAVVRFSIKNWSFIIWLVKNNIKENDQVKYDDGHGDVFQGKIYTLDNDNTFVIEDVNHKKREFPLKTRIQFVSKVR